MKNTLSKLLLLVGVFFASSSYAQTIHVPGGAPNYKPSVASPASLPATGNSVGDARVSKSNASIYIWDGAAWQGTAGGGAAAWGAIIGTLSSQTDLNTALNGKEPTITATTTADYYRGDKTFQTLNTLAVPELTNLYYTQARFDTAFGLKSTSNLAEGSNLYYTQGRFDTAFGLKSTSDLTEGSNLYYTDARASAAAPVQSVFGRTGAVIATSGDYDTSQVTENTNLYYTQGRFDTAFAAKNTDSLSEGVVNLYFTNARTLASVLTGYTSGAGVLSAADTVLSAIQKLDGNIGVISGSAITSLTGDGTATGPGASAFTLSTVNATTGTFGSASSVPVTTVNGKGLTTNVVDTPIAIAESQVTNLVSDLALKAPLASPALTGIPTVPTASAGNNSTQAASTAYADAAAAASQTGIYYHYPVVAGVVENDIVMNAINPVNSQAPLSFKKAVNNDTWYYAQIYGVAKNVSGGFADIYTGKGTVVPGFSFGAFIGVEYYIDAATPGALTFTPPSGQTNVIKVGRALDATHLILDPVSNFVQAKGALYTNDGSGYDSTLLVGGNGNVLVANSAATNGINWAPAVVTAAPFTYTTSTRTLAAATATNAVAGILSAADHTTFAAKESALTFSTGLTRTTNTITVNTSQNIATLSNLTTNGFVKTTGGTGALSVQTALTASDLPNNGLASISGNTTGSSTNRYYLGDTSGGAFTFTLPAASSNSSVMFVVKNVTFGGANAIAVARTGADTIEGATSDSIGAGEVRKYLSNGTNWFLAQ